MACCRAGRGFAGHGGCRSRRSRCSLTWGGARARWSLQEGAARVPKARSGRARDRDDVPSQKGGASGIAALARRWARPALRSAALVQRRWVGGSQSCGSWWVCGWCSRVSWRWVSRALQAVAVVVASVTGWRCWPVVRGVGGEDECLQGVQGCGGARVCGGVGPGGGGVGCEVDAPAGCLLDAVVAAAEGEQVGGGGGAGGPGSDVVEVAEPGGDRAAGEAAAAVAGLDQGGERGAGSVGVGGELVVGVESGAGQRVARHERRLGLFPPRRTRWSFREVVAQPAAAHQQRFGGSGALHLDQVVVVVRVIPARVGCRVREVVHGGGGGRRWMVGCLAPGLLRDHLGLVRGGSRRGADFLCRSGPVRTGGGRGRLGCCSSGRGFHGRGCG